MHDVRDAESPRLDRPPVSLRTLIAASAARSPEAPAIDAPGRAPLSWSGLVTHIDAVGGALRARGVGKEDRVAVVLANGPEMATAFLAVASACACAPLNPNYREQEFDFYLGDLDAKALMVARGVDSPARGVAAARGIPVVEIEVEPGGAAGLFALCGDNSADGAAAPLAGQRRRRARTPHLRNHVAAEDRAPLARKPPRLGAKRGRDARAFRRRPLPQRHAALPHPRLVGALLSSLDAGACVVCTPGFLAPQFFDWAEEMRPPGTPPCPTMHQAILARAAMAAPMRSRSAPSASSGRRSRRSRRA